VTVDVERTVARTPRSPGCSAAADPQLFEFRLYLAGQSPKSMRAVDNLRRMCEEHLPGRYQLEVIDLLERPDLARRDEIIALPTLVRTSPRPLRRIIGDLSDTEKLLAGLSVGPERTRS
jgi:circadian clock protein KaiB